MKSLVLDSKINIYEFQITRPDLETIFLRATKENWDKSDNIERGKTINHDLPEMT